MQLVRLFVVSLKQFLTRMTTYNQQASVSNKFTGGSGSSIGVTCTEDGNLITRTAITTTSTLPRFVFTWYCLKDI